MTPQLVLDVAREAIWVMIKIGAPTMVVALVVGLLVSLLSSNSHDRSLEAAMTGAFVLGPLAAVVAFAVGYVRAGRRQTGRETEG